MKIINKDTYEYIKTDTGTTDEMIFHGLKKILFVKMIFLFFNTKLLLIYF